MRFLLLFHIYYGGNNTTQPSGCVTTIIETNLENYDKSFKRATDAALQEWKRRYIEDQGSLYKIILHQIILLPDPKIPVGFGSAEE